MLMPDENFDVDELICNESFQQYCLGGAIENQIIWENWISRYPHRKADFEEAKNIVNILTVKQGRRNEQLQELKGGLAQREKLNKHLGLELAMPSVKKHRQRKLYLYTASVAALLFLGALIWLYSMPGQHAANETFVAINTPRKTLILSDGSVVTLARGSRIELDKNFSPLKRQLFLSGEAFFEIRHDAAHPFIVHTSHNEIRVLGTSFNVKAYPESGVMETALIRGSVIVSSKQDPKYFVVLKPNQKLISKNSDQLPAANAKDIYRVSSLGDGTASVPEEIQWIRKRLDIDNLPLATIAQKLQDWYGIEIIIADEEVKNYRYSGVFENETILKTLEALQLSYPFKFTVKEDKIIIKK